jgi:hypothetical protein
MSGRSAKGKLIPADRQTGRGREPAPLTVTVSAFWHEQGAVAGCAFLPIGAAQGSPALLAAAGPLTIGVSHPVVEP